jgi:hypothetical protein
LPAAAGLSIVVGGTARKYLLALEEAAELVRSIDRFGPTALTLPPVSQ